MNGHVVDVTLENFQREVIERSRELPVVVDFWAGWCAPCRTLGPVLERAVGALGGKVVLAKVDADTNPELCQAYNVSGIPAVKAFRDGRVVSEFVGAQPAQIVEAWLSGLVPSARDEVLESARRAVREDRPALAEHLLREYDREHPRDPTVLLELARIIAARGNRDEALVLLDLIPEAAPEAEEAAREKQLLDLLAAGGSVRSLDEARVRVEQRPGDLDAHFTLAGAAWLSGRPELAMEELLEIVRRDRSYREDGARRALLALFERLGHDHPAVGPAVNKLGMILFS